MNNNIYGLLLIFTTIALSALFGYAMDRLFAKRALRDNRAASTDSSGADPRKAL